MTATKKSGRRDMRFPLSKVPVAKAANRNRESPSVNRAHLNGKIRSRSRTLRLASLKSRNLLRVAAFI